VVDFLFKVFALFSVMVDSLSIFVIVTLSVMKILFDVLILFSDYVELMRRVFVLFLKFVVMVFQFLPFFVDVVVLVFEFVQFMDFVLEVNHSFSEVMHAFMVFLFQMFKLFVEVVMLFFPFMFLMFRMDALHFPCLAFDFFVFPFFSPVMNLFLVILIII
jgi:hypothetical protein